MASIWSSVFGRTATITPPAQVSPTGYPERCWAHLNLFGHHPSLLFGGITLQANAPTPRHLSLRFTWITKIIPAPGKARELKWVRLCVLRFHFLFSCEQRSPGEGKAVWSFLCLFTGKMHSLLPSLWLALAREVGDILQKGSEISDFLCFNIIPRKPKSLAVNIWGRTGTTWESFKNSWGQVLPLKCELVSVGVQFECGEFETPGHFSSGKQDPLTITRPAWPASETEWSGESYTWRRCGCLGSDTVLVAGQQEGW